MNSFSAKAKRSGIHVSHPCHCVSRIETFLLLAAFFMVVRYILDVFRRRSNNNILLFFLHTMHFLPYALLHYTMGLMQVSKSNNDMYEVWALVLVTLHYSIRAVRLSGIYRKQNPLQDMMSSLWTANLLGTNTTLLKIPLWLLWSLNSVRMILGFTDTELTSSRNGRQLRLLTEYMRTEHELPGDCDATIMKGYRYLVQGEDKQKIKSEPPEYQVQLEVTDEKKFVTIEKVWKQNGGLFCKPGESNELKDLCLAFAMFKLLRRRFFGLPIHEAKQPKTKNLVLTGLINNNNYNRVFKIIEAELSFFNDFFFTQYPVIFARGFPFLRLVVSLSVIGVSFSLCLIFFLSKDHLESELSKTINGIFVTTLLLFILTAKEIWEMVTYVLSDWTKVVLISNYVQEPWWTRCPALVAGAKLLCKYQIVKRWHGTLWQYNILQSFRSHHWFIRKLFYMLGCHFRLVLPGRKGNPPNKDPERVKLVIITLLQELSNKPEDMDKYLLTAVNSLHESLPPGLEKRLPLPNNIRTETENIFRTETENILIWHVATCYCEIKLAEDYKTKSKFSKINSPFLLENIEVQQCYQAATALSQHAAHLLARQYPLVPDWNRVATGIFRSTLNATRVSLQSCNSWENVLHELNKLADEEINGGSDGDGEDKVEGIQKIVIALFRSLQIPNRRRLRKNFPTKGKHILKDGVKLGRALLVEIKTDVQRWFFLENFWAGYLLYLAAAISVKDHKESLAGGGEFITHVWALLSHADFIEKTIKDDPSAMRDFMGNKDEDN